jgi:hypothetical protein
MSAFTRIAHTSDLPRSSGDTELLRCAVGMGVIYLVFAMATLALVALPPSSAATHRSVAATPAVASAGSIAADPVATDSPPVPCKLSIAGDFSPGAAVSAFGAHLGYVEFEPAY